jgi:hypothetical protein
MITRKEEVDFRKLMLFTGKKHTNNIKAIHIQRHGIQIELKESRGYIDHISDIVCAPCSIGKFTIPWVRTQTDSEIIEQDIKEFYEWQAEEEANYEAQLEDELNEFDDYYDGPDSYNDLDDCWGDEGWSEEYD